MRIQWKVTFLVLGVVVATLAAVLWQTRALVVKDKLGFMADAAMKQMAPLKRLVEERLDEKKNKLLTFATERTQSGLSVNGRGPRDFDVIAMMQAYESVNWSPTWIERTSAAKPESWPQGYDLTLLNSLSYAKVKDGETVWVRLSDRQGTPIYAILMAVQIHGASASAAAKPEVALPESAAQNPGNGGRRVILVGFTSQNPLTEMAEDYIGSTNTVYIVDEKGYVASHVNRSYLGALFSEDPLVREIIDTRKAAASGTFEDLDGKPVLGHFEKIDHANLYAVITTPVAGAQAFIDNFVRTGLIAGLAMGLVGILFAWLLGRGFSRKIENAINAIRSIHRGESVLIEAGAGKDEISTLTRLLSESSPAAPASATVGSGSMVSESGPRLADERRVAYEMFATGCVNALKEPLMAILGHAQLVEAKSQDAEVRAHGESIEREARHAKDVLEHMQTWSGDTLSSSSVDVKPVSAREALENVLRKLERQLEDDGITIVKDLQDVPTLSGSPEAFEAAIRNLVENAREAMVARHPKVLRVRTEFSNDSILVTVKDNGIGMTRDVCERAFEPFFKGFDNPKRLGLGLTQVEAVVKSMGGEREIETSPGEGTTVTLKLPVGASEIEAFRERRADASRAGETESEDGDRGAPTKTEGHAAVATSLEHLDFIGDDNDEPEENFTNFSLHSTKQNETPQINSDGSSESFRVNVRRPRVRG